MDIMAIHLVFFLQERRFLTMWPLSMFGLCHEAPSWSGNQYHNLYLKQRKVTIGLVVFKKYVKLLSGDAYDRRRPIEICHLCLPNCFHCLGECSKLSKIMGFPDSNKGTLFQILNISSLKANTKWT